jgi:hypothetical protein
MSLALAGPGISSAGETRCFCEGNVLASARKVRENGWNIAIEIDRKFARTPWICLLNRRTDGFADLRFLRAHRVVRSRPLTASMRSNPYNKGSAARKSCAR